MLAPGPVSSGQSGFQTSNKENIFSPITRKEPRCARQTLGFRARISTLASGEQCHLTHLIILRGLSRPSWAQKRPEDPFIYFRQEERPILEK